MSRPSHTAGAGEYARELRQQMPWSKTRLWSVIRGKATGARFRRQVPIGDFIADFASLDPRLVIEVDGNSHNYQDETERTSFLESHGFTVIRVNNEDVRDNLNGVFEYIREVVEALR